MKSSPEETLTPVVSLESVELGDVAALLSSLPLGTGQMEEVQDAVIASAYNGYDQEYRMTDLFAQPGRGVGDALTKASRDYERPLRELLRQAGFRTKAEGQEVWLEALEASDVQIYWPNAEDWDSETLPVITFDPEDGVAVRNAGYELLPDGEVRKVMVDEAMSQERPVWVVNRNRDGGHPSLELLRRQGEGGTVVVLPSGDTKAASTGNKTLVLRSFKAFRQFDSWFAGASEFFVKMGAVDDFTASTEAEMRIFDPTITDFLIVMRRKQLGEEMQLNAVLVSDWIPEIYSCAFMITEDDGGTRTSWKASAVVKYNSKSYGIDLEIPLNTRDDIVWRGSLTRNYIERYNGIACGYGDVELVMELI